MYVYVVPLISGSSLDNNLKLMTSSAHLSNYTKAFNAYNATCLHYAYDRDTRCINVNKWYDNSKTYGEICLVNRNHYNLDYPALPSFSNNIIFGSYKRASKLPKIWLVPVGLGTGLPSTLLWKGVEINSESTITINLSVAILPSNTP
jgi:hypothetical protein